MRPVKYFFGSYSDVRLEWFVTRRSWQPSECTRDRTVRFWPVTVSISVIIGIDSGDDRYDNRLMTYRNLSVSHSDA